MIDNYTILSGDNISQPVGPFPTEDDAHDYYQRNQPHSKKHPYLTKPKIIRLLRPAYSERNYNITAYAVLDIADCLADGDYDGRRGAEALRFLAHEIDPAICINGHLPDACGCDVTDTAEQGATAVPESDRLRAIATPPTTTSQ